MQVNFVKEQLTFTISEQSWWSLQVDTVVTAVPDVNDEEGMVVTFVYVRWAVVIFVYVRWAVVMFVYIRGAVVTFVYVIGVVVTLKKVLGVVSVVKWWDVDIDDVV